MSAGAATLRRPLLILAAAQPVDIATTLLVFNLGGAEQNPLTALIIRVGGLGLVLGLKLAVVASIGVKALIASRLSPEALVRTRRRVLFVAGIYTFVVSWNAAMLLLRGA